jgi:hypothetical protein
MYLFLLIKGNPSIGVLKTSLRVHGTLHRYQTWELNRVKMAADISEGPDVTMRDAAQRAISTCKSELVRFIKNLDQFLAEVEPETIKKQLSDRLDNYYNADDDFATSCGDDCDTIELYTCHYEDVTGMYINAREIINAVCDGDQLSEQLKESLATSIAKVELLDMNPSHSEVDEPLPQCYHIGVHSGHVESIHIMPHKQLETPVVSPKSHDDIESMSVVLVNDDLTNDCQSVHTGGNHLGSAPKNWEMFASPIMRLTLLQTNIHTGQCHGRAWVSSTIRMRQPIA